MAQYIINLSSTNFWTTYSRSSFFFMSQNHVNHAMLKQCRKNMKVEIGHKKECIVIRLTQNQNKSETSIVWSCCPKWFFVTGNNLESKGSIRKNNKRALRTVKGHFVWLLILRYPYLKTIFGIFRSK